MWGGKGDKEKKAGSLRKTNGEVDGIVAQLVKVCFDKNTQVRMSMTYALHDLGYKQPALVISTIIHFCTKNKPDHEHRVQLLKIMVKILEQTRDTTDDDLAKEIIAFASTDMIATEDVKTDWQDPCSQLLVLLSVPFGDHVVDNLLTHFTAGVVPHYYIVKTLADIAVANPISFTMRLKDVIRRVIPVLGSVKKAPMMWVFATAVGRFSEAMHHFQSNANDEQKKEVQPNAFATDLGSGFDVIFSRWSGAKELQVRLAVSESLGHMASMIDDSTFTQTLPKLIPSYLGMYKKEKPSDYLPISTGLAMIMKVSVKEPHRGLLLPLLLPQIFQTIHPLVCRPIDFKDNKSLKNHNELLRCFENIARGFPDETIDFVVQRFQEKTIPARLGSLIILRHFVNSLDEELKEKKDMIMSSVGTLVGETHIEVKKSILQLIVSMSNKLYLPLEGGQTLVSFVVRQCALPDAPEAQGKGEDAKVTNGVIKSSATHILYVMATKVKSAEPVLWPFLLELINNAKYSPAIVVLAKCIAQLGNLKRERGDEDFNINFDTLVNIPSPQNILARCMVLASVPLSRDKSMAPAICSMMGALGPIIHQAVGKYWDESVPSLIAYLEANADDLNVGNGRIRFLSFLKKHFKLSIRIVGYEIYVLLSVNKLNYTKVIMNYSV